MSRRHTLRSFSLVNIYVVIALTNQISVYMKETNSWWTKGECVTFIPQYVDLQLTKWS